MDWLTNPAVVAVITVVAALTYTKWPKLSALLSALVTTKPNADLIIATADTESRCEVLRGVRHDISEQPDPEQRAKDLALCDEFRAMLKRLGEPKAAA